MLGEQAQVQSVLCAWPLSVTMSLGWEPGLAEFEGLGGGSEAHWANSPRSLNLNPFCGLWSPSQDLELSWRPKSA